MSYVLCISYTIIMQIKKKKKDNIHNQFLITMHIKLHTNYHGVSYKLIKWLELEAWDSE